MAFEISRRQFMAGLSAAIVLPGTQLRAALETEHKIITSSASTMKFGYAAITWEANDLQAIKDISELGFKGIQLRSNILKDYGERPAELRDLLAQYKLEMVALSSGGVRIDTATRADEMAKHAANAKFVHDVGGKYLQVTDSARAKDRKPTADDFKQLGQVLTEIGKRANDLGVPVGYHNHMNSLGEAPDEVEQIMAAVDPAVVKLELDIAHYQQGGGDPAKAINHFRDRLLFLHIKDVENTPPTATQPSPYRFVELGKGRVDLPAVFAALKRIKYDGWAIIELDRVVDKSQTPKEAALISKQYLVDKLGMKI